jgi:hypothetical protein
MDAYYIASGGLNYDESHPQQCPGRGSHAHAASWRESVVVSRGTPVHPPHSENLVHAAAAAFD